MKVFMCLLIASIASLSHAHYHVLVAGGTQQDGEGSPIPISSHMSRHRRSLTHRDDILASLGKEEYLGSGDEDISGDIQEFQFYMKNNDTANAAQTTISELMPGNAVLMDFSIHNEGQTYRYDRNSQKSLEEATVEYQDSVAKGLSAVILGDVKTTLDRCSDCRTDEIDPDQAVAAIVNIAPGDILSVSLSYVVPVTVDISEMEKETYRTDVTIDLDLSAQDVFGVLMSPNYPDDYPNSADVTWLIYAPIYEMVISANMISFDTEACCDHLYIYDGPTDTHPLLYVGSGSISGPESFVTTRSSMLVKFQTDSTINDGGFALEFHPTERKVITDDPAEDDKNNNGTVIMLAADGTLKSPNYPVSYPAASRIVWDIVVETGDTIDFRIIDFDVFYGETLEVVDLNSSAVYATFNNTAGGITPFEFSTSSSAVSVVFQTLNKVLPKRGLYGMYFSRRAEEIYLQQQDTAWHNITSPHYPHHYGNDERQVWIITAVDQTSLIRIEVTSLNLEEGYDFLYIYNGASIDQAQIMATLSGMGGHDIEYISDENTATVVFESDHSISGEGFELRYTNYRVYTTLSYSTQTINGGSGVVRNSNYPSSVYIYDTCRWLIRVDESKKVAVILRDFYGSYAYIYFYDGSSTSDRLIWSSNGDYNIDYEDGISAMSSSNEMLVVMSESYYYSVYVRYMYSFEEVEGNHDPHCRNTSVLTVAPGQITSANYPEYAPYEDCSWLIEAPLEYQVLATFQQIYTSSSSSSSYRMVKFYDGSSTGSQLIASCSIYYCPVGYSVRSSSRYLLVVSDVISTLRFKLQYQFENGLSLYINREIGSAMSPSFPDQYPDSYYQVTYIEVPSGRITFYFQVFETESCCDFLSLYDGDSTSSRLIYTISGDQAGMGGETSGPYLTLKFSSDGSGAGSGFRMDYCSTTQDCVFLGDENSAYTYLLQPMFNHEYYIVSPGAPEYYPDNNDFYWFLECPDESTYNSRYQFTRVDIDESDSLMLYTGFQVDKNNIALDWSDGYLDYVSSYSVYVYSPRSLLWFHSDTAFSGLGFLINYICYD